MRLTILGVGLLAASVLGAEPGTRPIDLDDLGRLRGVSDAQISPDGTRVAYTVRATDLKKDRGETHIMVTSWDGKSTTALTAGRDSESRPRWSPDGRSLAFLSSRGDANHASQVWLLPMSGGEAQKVTELDRSVEEFDWSPDGKRMVLVLGDPDPDSGKDGGSKARPIVVNRYQFKADGDGYLGGQHTHLYLLGIADHKVEPLTSGDFDDLLPAWSPDGKTIAFVTKRGEDPDRTDNWDVYAIEPRPGAVARALTTSTNADNQPDWESTISWSPDSKWVAYLQGGPDKLIYYAIHNLAIVPAAGGAPRVLTPNLDRNPLSPRFTPDGTAVLFLLEDDQAAHLAKVPVAGGPVERVVGGRQVVSGFSVAGNGRVAALIGGPLAPREAYAIDAGGPRRLSHENDAWLAEVKLGAVEETRFRSKDGTEIHGFLVKPPDYQAGRRYPTILRLHGGPVDQLANSFEFDWQIFAAHGYAVVAVNPRGSSGRGEKFQTAIYADWGHVDVEDVLAGVDDAVARGVADPERLAVGGWSYGGMLTNYVIASTTRFKAAASGAGSGNIFTAYGIDQYIREYEQELGQPWKNVDAWMKVSYPFFHVDRITTPTLYLCGDADFNMPLSNSEQMFQALRSRGVPTELVIYPGQHHGIRRPGFVRDRLERYLAWYGKYTSAAPSAAGSH
jgi:dipeptidyl aminopeptidase/acylaminoacyl peptidase